MPPSPAAASGAPELLEAPGGAVGEAIGAVADPASGAALPFDVDDALPQGLTAPGAAPEGGLPEMVPEPDEDEELPSLQ